MKMIKLLLAILFSIAITSCGGGSSSSSGTTTPTTTTATLSGTAAKGAAFASVAVSIKDKNGSAKTGTTGTDGKYSIDITGMTAPFLLKVSDGTNTYYSVSTAAGTAIANIHQFTDLIIRNWYKVKGADIDTVFSGSGALSQVPTASEIDTIAAVVINILSNWFSSVGLSTSTFNLITSSFNADGAGFDKVLDNNTVTIDASGNVTVTSTDPTTGTQSTIATTTTSTDLTGGTHANGTYTWNSTTGELTWNWTSSNFVCEGPQAGDVDTDTVTSLTSTTLTVTWTDGGGGSETWTRSSGDSAGEIVGTWTISDSTTGNSWTITFNADGTVSVVGDINECSGGGKDGGGTTGTAPSAPTGVTATAGDGQVTISWTAVSGATSYNIYMAPQSGVTKDNYTTLTGGMKHNSTTTSYNHISLINGTTYYFVVTAVNTSGESVESAQVSGTPTGGTATYDDFTTSTINQSLWDGYGSSGVLSQSNGFLHANGPPNSQYGNIGSKYRLSGDFEVILDYREFSSTATVFTGNVPQIWLQVSPEASGNEFIAIWRALNPSPFGHTIRSFGTLAGDASAAATTTAGQLKISRIGSAITTSYNEGIGWVTLYTYSSAFTGNVIMQIATYTGDNGTFHVASDWIMYTGQLISAQ